MSLMLARFVDTKTNTKFLGFLAQAEDPKDARYFLAENGNEINTTGRYKCLYTYPWYFNLNEIIMDEFEKRAKSFGYDWLKIDDETDGFYYDRWQDEV